MFPEAFKTKQMQEARGSQNNPLQTKFKQFGNREFSVAGADPCGKQLPHFWSHMSLQSSSCSYWHLLKVNKKYLTDPGPICDDH